jgi:twitching motility two-component system response regulator PilG
MSKQKQFTIALCGFPENEEKSLIRAFQLSAVRPQHYLLWSQTSNPPDICIINDDLPLGLQCWRELRRSFFGTNFPVVRVGSTDAPAAFASDVVSIFFKRPTLASRILKTLDELVSDVYHFAPELAIRDDPSAQAMADYNKTQSAPVTAPSAKRILVVDDSESVRTMMEVRLVKAGHAVDFAITGEEALTRVQERVYQLIFLDVMLPGINGYEVCRILKRKLRIAAPVVLLTGKTSRFDKLRGTFASADVYLTKPLSIEHLNTTLKRYLS